VSNEVTGNPQKKRGSPCRQGTRRKGRLYGQEAHAKSMGYPCLQHNR